MKHPFALVFSMAALSLSLISPLSALAEGSSCANLFEAVAPIELTVAERYKSLESIPFLLQNGRLVSVDLIPPSKAGMPYLMLLPGVNRGMLPSDEAVTALAALGYGIAGLNFSTQALSLAKLPKGQKPYFKNHEMTIHDFADEANGVIQFLKTKGVSRVVPIDLSFSGITSPYLKGSDLQISISPMTSWAAVAPPLASLYSSLKSAELFNPFFGASVTRQMLDSSYRSKWVDKVNELAQQFKFTDQQKPDMVDGYMAQSRAVEAQSWDVSKLDPAVRRVFILGIEEAVPLFQNQLQTVQELMAAHIPIVLVVVKNAGHMVPGDQPKAFSAVVGQVVSRKLGFDTGMLIVDPKNDKTQIFVGVEMIKKIEQLLAANVDAKP